MESSPHSLTPPILPAHPCVWNEFAWRCCTIPLKQRIMSGKHTLPPSCVVLVQGWRQEIPRGHTDPFNLWLPVCLLSLSSEHRCVESAKIRNKYPDRVPVSCGGWVLLSEMEMQRWSEGINTEISDIQPAWMLLYDNKEVRHLLSATSFLFFSNYKDDRWTQKSFHIYVPTCSCLWITWPPFSITSHISVMWRASMPFSSSSWRPGGAFRPEQTWKPSNVLYF